MDSTAAEPIRPMPAPPPIRTSPAPMPPPIPLAPLSSRNLLPVGPSALAVSTHIRSVPPTMSASATIARVFDIITFPNFSFRPVKSADGFFAIASRPYDPLLHLPGMAFSSSSVCVRCLRMILMLVMGMMNVDRLPDEHRSQECKDEGLEERDE